MNEDKYPSKAVMVLDIMSAAISIDECFGKFLASPAQGAYLPGQMEPILKAMTAYYLYTTVGSEPWTVQYGLYQHRYNLHGAMRTDHQREARVMLDQKVMGEKVTYQQAIEMQRGVMDAEGKVLVPDHLIHKLSETPTVPVTALWIVRELVEDYLHQFRAWEPRNADHSNEIVLKYLSKSVLWSGELNGNTNLYQVYRDHHSGETYNRDDVVEDIIKQVRLLRSQIADFIGEDEWKVHFFRYHGARAVSLVKSEDYRIIVYNEKKASGEW